MKEKIKEFVVNHGLTVLILVSIVLSMYKCEQKEKEIREVEKLNEVYTKFEVHQNYLEGYLDGREARKMKELHLKNE